MPVRELNTSTKIETAPAPSKPGFLLYHAPRVSGHAGITLRVTRGKTGGVRRTIQVIARGPDRHERRVFISDWPPEEGKSLMDVLALACEVRDRVKRGQEPYPPPALLEAGAAPTVTAIWERYLKAHASSKKPSTRSNDERLWRLHIRPHLGTKTPQDLTYEVLKRWYAGLAKKSVVNANRTYKLMKAVFNAAKHRWHEPWARENPFDIMRSDDRQQENERIIVLSAPQRSKLLQCIREHPVPKVLKHPRRRGEPDGSAARAQRQSANCLLLIALTGCRKGEALNARWSEFDLDSGIWSIPATRTKQAKTTRIPLLPDALAHVRELYRNRVSDNLLFPQAADTQRAQDNLKRSWRSIIERAELTEVPNLANGTVGELRIHDLRHAFGTLAVEAGLPLEVVARLLGHSQISTTLRYAHIHDGIVQAGIERLASHLAKSADNGHATV